MKQTPFSRTVLFRSAAALLLSVAPAAAQAPRTEEKVDAAYVKAHYTKYEYLVPMRDGVRLFTAVYLPKDQTKKYPFLILRTPYSVRPYGADRYPDRLGPSALFTREGFIFVYQDVRGRMASEGEFVHVRPHKPSKSGPRDIDESTDTYDTIEWLLKHIPNHNGRAGLWGISYPGFYAAAGMIDSHPALKAVSPQAPIADWFIGDDWHHNGAFYLAHTFTFFYRFGTPVEEPTRRAPEPFDYKTPDGYEFYLQMGPLANANEKYFKNKIPFWNELMEHGTYDEFWQARNLLPHLNRIRAAVMTVGGWFDAEDLYGPLKIYESVEKRNPGIVNLLVMGPWRHGGWSGDADADRLGPVSFNSKTGPYYREKIELAFFVRFLKDESAAFDAAEAIVFETGAHQWRRYEAWPPREAEPATLYLQPGGGLSGKPPVAARDAFDEYVSDPAKPVPYIPYIAQGMTVEHMIDDQRFAARRTDVLVYQTGELATDVTLAGPIKPTLFVSTTGTDSDFVVKLIDVYPGDFPDPDPNPAGVRMGGYQQLVRGEVFRGKFRNSFEKPEPFTPGQVSRIEFVMPDVHHTFRRGHRIMVQIQSSWFPLVDRNPQKFVDIYKAKEEDFQKATQRVYRSPEHASRIEVRLLRSPAGTILP
jgi:putative CocE/NonD family hydrolase